MEETAEAKAALHHEKEDEEEAVGLRNLSRSILQKIIAQDIRVYLIWLALYGHGEHRLQIRYLRGCKPKAPDTETAIPKGAIGWGFATLGTQEWFDNRTYQTKNMVKTNDPFLFQVAYNATDTISSKTQGSDPI